MGHKVIRQYIVCLLFTLCLFHVHILPAVSNAFNPVVHVEILNTSPDQAKAAALTAARQQAWVQMLKTLLPKKEWQTLPSLSDETALTLLDHYVIEGEKTSDARYDATIHYFFNPTKVKATLREHHFSFSETPLPKILVIPMTQNKNGQNILWGSDNPWLAVWQKTRFQPYHFMITTPLGDQIDQEILSEADLKQGNVTAMKILANRYGVEHMVIILHQNPPAALSFHDISDEVDPLFERQNSPHQNSVFITPLFFDDIAQQHLHVQLPSSTAELELPEHIIDTLSSQFKAHHSTQGHAIHQSPFYLVSDSLPHYEANLTKLKNLSMVQAVQVRGFSQKLMWGTIDYYGEAAALTRAIRNARIPCDITLGHQT